MNQNQADSGIPDDSIGWENALGHAFAQFVVDNAVGSQTEQLAHHGGRIS
jgi:hypothetical protein